MGIVSDKEFESEKKKTQVIESTPIPLLRRDELKDESRIEELPSKGRGNNPAVPESLRKFIGAAAINEGREAALELAKDFGISESSVSAYSKGATSTASYNERPNLGIINESKLRIQRKARGKMILAINMLTKEKLDLAKPRDLAGIAKDMAIVTKAMEPEVAQGSTEKSGPTFIFYAPQQRKEETFDIVFPKE